MSKEIKLPPLPEPDINTASHIGQRIVGYTEKTVKRLRLEAVEADRAERQEPDKPMQPASSDDMKVYQGIADNYHASRAAQQPLTNQSPSPEYDRGFSDGWDRGHAHGTSQPLSESKAKAIAGEIFPMGQLENAATFHRRLCEIYGIGGEKPEPPHGWSAERHAKYMKDVEAAGGKP